MTDQAPMTDEQAIERLDALVSRAFLENDADSHMRAAIQHLRDRLRAGVEAVADVFEAYKSWPDDLRAKLSVHDLRRMGGWAPKPNVGDWRIDNSAGRPILVHKDCSVIEAEDARYVLGLIAADAAPPRAPVAEAVERAAEVPAVDKAALRKALTRAWQFGQSYWAEADSESHAANRRAETTREKYLAFVEETIAALSRPAAEVKS